MFQEKKYIGHYTGVQYGWINIKIFALDIFWAQKRAQNIYLHLISHVSCNKYIY